MTGQLLRKKFMRRFVGMTKYSRASAWGVVCIYATTILAAVVLGAWLVAQPLTIWSGLAIAAIVLFIGTRLRGINNIVHECSHASFAEERVDNVAVGSVCASLLLKSFKRYRDDHLSHHAHLGDYEMDHEFAVIEKLGLHDPLSLRTILRHAVTPLTGRHLPMYVSMTLSREDGNRYFALKLGLLAATAIVAILSPMTALLFLILPLVYVYPTLNFWTDCLDHAGLIGATDELVASRNVLAPAPVRAVFFPRNDCYHLVHHLFPQVPARHLKTAHLELCTDPDYGTQPLAVRPTHLEIGKYLQPAFRRGGDAIQAGTTEN